MHFNFNSSFKLLFDASKSGNYNKYFNKYLYKRNKVMVYCCSTSSHCCFQQYKQHVQVLGWFIAGFFLFIYEAYFHFN